MYILNFYLFFQEYQMKNNVEQCKHKQMRYQMNFEFSAPILCFYLGL